MNSTKVSCQRIDAQRWSSGTDGRLWKESASETEILMPRAMAVSTFGGHLELPHDPQNIGSGPFIY